jgi:drug/metabolite transporter (DMT)-like permease
VTPPASGFRPHLDFTAVALTSILCALWGFNQAAVKLANAGISPALQAGFRSIGAAILLLAWSHLRGVRLFERDGTLGAGLLAGALFAVEFALIYGSLDYTTASRTVIFLYTAPFFVALGSHLFVTGERLRLAQVVGLFIAFLGVVVAFAEHVVTPAGPHSEIGDLMALTAGAIWGATTVVFKASALIRVSPDKTLFYQLAVSAVLLPLFSLLLGEPGVFAPTPGVWASVAFQIVIVAFASYLVWFWLVKHYPAARVSAFTFLTPLFGVAAGALMLGEPVTWMLLLSLALVAPGIYLVNRPASALRQDRTIAS